MNLLSRLGLLTLQRQNSEYALREILLPHSLPQA